MCTDVVKEIREAYQDNLQAMYAAGWDAGIEACVNVGIERGRAAAARDLVRQTVAEYGALSPCAWAEYRPVLDGLPVHQIPNAIAVTARLLAHPPAQRSAVAWDILHEAQAIPAPPDTDSVPDADRGAKGTL